MLYHDVLRVSENLLLKKQFSQLLAFVRSKKVTYTDNLEILSYEALAHKGMGNSKTSLSLMARCVAEDPKNAKFHNILAEVYQDLGMTDKAGLHFKASVSLDVEFIDSHKNLIKFYILIGEYDLLNSFLDICKTRFFNNEGMYCFVGDCYRINKLYAQATTWYENVLEFNSSSITAIYNLAICFRMLGRAKDSVIIIKRSKINNDQLNYLKSLCLFDMGDLKGARRILEELHHLKTGNVSYLEALAELDWQEDRFSCAIERYINVLTNHGENFNDALVSYISKLIQSDMNAELERVLIEYSHQSASYTLQLVKARAYQKLNESKKASKIYEQLVEINPDPFLGLEFAEFLVCSGVFDQAESVLTRIYPKLENNQKVLALLSCIWREKSDERYFWLNDFEKFVGVRKIDVPADFESLQDFLDNLERVILGLHSTKKEPLDQSVKGGTQTPGRLFFQDEYHINQLVEVLNDQISSFINSLSKNRNHPFLNRNTHTHKFSGSWSVALKDGGFHVSHVHPEGWISSAFYVRTVETEEQDGGNILFGRAPYKSLKNNSVEREIKPEPGMLVLFPSYFWHETKPFHNKNINEDSKRITTPFDLIPG